ncbi:hypothetical protein ACF0H5_010509 [Mactra antiquata]
MEEANYISLVGSKISRSVNASSEYEIETILEHLSNQIECGFLSEDQALFLRRKYRRRRTWSTNRDQLTNLLNDISMFVTRKDLIHIAFNLGIPNIHEILRNFFLQMPRHQNTTEIQCSKYLRKLLFKYKSQCDDNVFRCRIEMLQREFHKYSNGVQIADNRRQKEIMSNAKAIIGSLLIQQHIDEHDIQQHMTVFTEGLPSGVDTTLPQLLGLCKRAIMSAKRQDWMTAEHYKDEALSIGQRFSDTTIWYLVQHHIIYLHQLNLQEIESKENREQALEVCQRTLDMIVFDKQDNFSVMVYRQFCLYTLFIRLRVGPYYEIDTTTTISREDMKESKQMLQRVECSFSNHLYHVEDRRKIMFYILKARHCQLKNKKVLALGYISKAERIMEIGTPYQSEITNLERFKERLQIETDQWTVTTELPPLTF